MISELSTGPQQLQAEDEARRIPILHILEATSAGAARYVCDVLLHIDTSRFDVTFVYSLERSDAKFLDDLQAIQRRGIKTIHIPMCRSIRLGLDARAFLALWKLMREHRYELVHTHSSKAGFLGRIAAKLASQRTKTLYCPHAISVEYNRLYWILEQCAGRFTDMIVGVSKSERDQLVRLRLVPEEHVRYITAAIDTASYESFVGHEDLRTELGLGLETVLVGTAGRLSPQKDPLLFVGIAAKVLEEHKDAHFIWAGDGELRDATLVRASELGIADRVHLLGYRRDLRPVLSQLDVFTLTSRYESFGYVTCEAMALGKPVVATRVAGTEDLVVPGETGALVTPGNVSAFANAISVLIGDRELRARFGALARSRARREFDLSRMLVELELLYLNTVGIPQLANPAAASNSLGHQIS